MNRNALPSKLASIDSQLSVNGITSLVIGFSIVTLQNSQL